MWTGGEGCVSQEEVNVMLLELRVINIRGGHECSRAQTDVFFWYQ